jgi:prevent-host-death family protein
MREVTASEFARNFGLYREIAQREPVAVTSHGRTTGYFVSVVEYDDLQRIKALMPRSRAVEELAETEIQEIAKTRMSKRHDDLDALLTELPPLER